jgi:hypothetical protein
MVFQATGFLSIFIIVESRVFNKKAEGSYAEGRRQKHESSSDGFGASV